MQRTAVIDVVGLTNALIGEHTPRIRSWIQSGAQVLPIAPVLPAVTTTAQTTYVTGKYPGEHGIVGNGWYSREDSEVKFWKQSNRLIQAPKVWDEARRRDESQSFTVAKSFWWYNMYSTADYAVTPRPMYPADGRKLPDVYTTPPQLRDELQTLLGQFPLFSFWGPRTNVESSRWIADAALYIEGKHSPTLHMIYLPHLDYCLQNTGTTAEQIASHLNEIDDIVGDLISAFEAADVDVILLSEYGICAVDHPVHINRALRKAGMITIRNELGRELLDAGACRAFAVSDHQIAHVYVQDPSAYEETITMLQQLDGVQLVLDEEGKKKHHIDHERAGDIVCVAEPNAWFTYYYWLDDDVAPDFARCVDIHRKPGYDPVELFVDPEIVFPTLKAGYRLAQKQLGFRYLMDLIPLDASLPVGSHGHLTQLDDHGAMFATKQTQFLDGQQRLEPTQVYDLILKHLNL